MAVRYAGISAAGTMIGFRGCNILCWPNSNSWRYALVRAAFTLAVNAFLSSLLSERIGSYRREPPTFEQAQSPARRK